MSSNTDHGALLDELQAQVNLVLEQTGRVFAAVNSTPKVPPVAHITKLQNTIPIASKRFHQALDQLENELQMAALVMRRDLAVCREQSNTDSKAAPKVPSESLTTPKAVASTSNLGEVGLGKAEEIFKEDIAMQDQSHDPAPDFPVIEEKPVPPAAEVDQKPVTKPSPDAKPSPEDVSREAVPRAANGSSKEEGAPQHDGLSIETATAEQDSKVDSKSGEEKAPDTATGDMDSLFNDPISAEDAAAANAFDFDQNNSNELDFGSFSAGFDSTGADNDNISSLLPGLEDYANTQQNAAADVMDFSSFFNTGDGGQNTGLDQQASGEQRDTTFDDLMDLANFEGMDGDDSNNNGNNHNADLDFEALFN
ncbi:uncharacterized protein RCC_04576 [Ramularia collo-cygni]|uniref:Uncharacterized protein n=1 Tax=Ramularia collo-cygni TaxID=112498 RepID=A0A2D3UPX7_9PEZI|nr:uncharacterized protein RCC_04576 [Ramularia collo-cygni]CZT18732.1 uncharacterized protein RCC_04576 [Ramularia collo-cygni]